MLGGVMSHECFIIFYNIYIYIYVGAFLTLEIYIEVLGENPVWTVDMLIQVK